MASLGTVPPLSYMLSIILVTFYRQYFLICVDSNPMDECKEEFSETDLSIPVPIHFSCNRK